MFESLVRTIGRARTPVAAAAVAMLALSAAGCGGGGSAASGAGTTTPAKVPAVKIGTAQIAGLGTVLVNGQHHALYAFLPDDRKQVSCVGACASIWPPLLLAAGQKPIADTGVKASLLGSDPNPTASGRVVTYAGWPLYAYGGDAAPGEATGQAKNLNGGFWYVMSPDGKLIKKSA